MLLLFLPAANRIKICEVSPDCFHFLGAAIRADLRRSFRIDVLYQDFFVAVNFLPMAVDFRFYNFSDLGDWRW